MEILDVELKVEAAEDHGPHWVAIMPAFRMRGVRHSIHGSGGTPAAALRSLHEQLDDICRPPTVMETVKAPPLERVEPPIQAEEPEPFP